MKYLILSLLLLLMAEISAQETEKAHIYNSSLQQGEVLNFGNRSIKFKNVVSDSRCPIGVTCIWAGEAIVSVEIYENGICIEERLLVVASSDNLYEFISGNMIYNIFGLNLSPLPSVNNQELPKDYKLQLKVKETERI